VQALNGHADTQNEQNEQGVHSPSAVIEKLDHFLSSQFS
jgi:hypothetical protein